MLKLSRDFYNRNTITVAKDLLGKYIIHETPKDKKIGRIVEVEAYLGTHDLAAHSSKGITKRTQIMFGAPGFSYVYLIYGIYHCLNVVTEPEGSGTAVLIRAVEPILNIELKTNGPGLLTKAMNIDLTLNAHDLLSEDFYIAEDAHSPTIEIVERKRIGVDYAKEWANALLRFYIQDNPYVSKK